MYMEFKLAILKSLNYSKKDADVAYVTLLSANPAGFGEVSVKMEGIQPEILNAMGRLPFNVQGDVEFSVWGSGQDARNNLTMTNVHVEDVLGIAQLAQQIMQPNGKTPKVAPVPAGDKK